MRRGNLANGLMLSLGRLGLLLDLVGAFLLWRGATPPVYRPAYGVIAPDDADPEKDEVEWNVKAAKWDLLNRIGVVLLVAGFGLQLIGTWASR